MSGKVMLSAKTSQAKLIADHWISYLRNGLSTCYYCVAPNSFPEELQRKCVAHVRPPMEVSGSAGPGPVADEAASADAPAVDDAAAAEAQHAGSAAPDSGGAPERDDREDVDMREAVGDERDVAAADDDAKGRSGDGKRDRPSARFHEERWAENLEHKIRPLLEQVDVTEYGGRDPDE